MDLHQNNLNSKNVLFLDFDGVCNSFEVGSHMTHPPEKYGIDPRNVGLVRKICHDGNALVVISSNWRRYEPDGFCRFGRGDYRNPLGGLYEVIGDLVYGTLPPTRHINKSKALEMWFAEHTEFSGKYAILDDDPREGYQWHRDFMSNFWLTSMKYGLTDRIANEIIAHFGGPRV